MRKKLFVMFATTLLCAVLTACGGNIGSSIISEYCDVISENIDSEGYMSDEFLQQLNEKFLGKTIATDIDGNVEFEIVSPFTIKDYDVQAGTIDLEAVLKNTIPFFSINRIVGCNGSTPVKHLRHGNPNHQSDGFHVTITLNIGRAIKKGGDAEKRIRDINRIVILGSDSSLDEDLKDYTYIKEIKDNGVFGRFPSFADKFSRKIYKAPASKHYELEMELRDSMRAILPTIVGNTIPTESTFAADVRVMEPFTVIDINIPDGPYSELEFNDQYAFVRLKASTDIRGSGIGISAIGFIEETPVFKFSGHLVDGTFYKPHDDIEVGDYIINIYVHPYDMGLALSRLDRIVFSKSKDEKDLNGFSIFEPYGYKDFGGDIYKTFDDSNIRIYE